MSVRRTLARPVVRGIALSAAVSGLALVAAGPALAHVSVSPDEAGAGDYAIATFSVPHGCDGSATTKVLITIPEQIVRVTPTRNALWDVEKKMVTLATPIQPEEGAEITERVASVVYTAKTPLPDGYRDAFELSFQVPDAVGETLKFPVTQTCVKGATEWNQTVAEGEAEPEHPTPVIKVVESSGGDHHGADEEVAAAEGEHAEADDAEGASKGLAYTGLGVGALGLLLGAAALGKSRKA